MEKILFVCTGNTCRSSMAEALFKDLAEDKEQEWEAMSAGLATVEGQPAAEEAVKVMAEEDIDLSEHKTTPLTEDLMKAADLVLTMTRRHKVSIVNLYPDREDKVHTLKEYTGQLEEEKRTNFDISDPFGQPIAVYKKCAGEIKQELKKLIKNLTCEEDGAYN